MWHRCKLGGVFIYIMIHTIIIALAFITVIGLLFFLLILAFLAMGKAICEDMDKNGY